MKSVSPRWIAILLTVLRLPALALAEPPCKLAVPLRELGAIEVAWVLASKVDIRDRPLWKRLVRTGAFDLSTLRAESNQEPAGLPIQLALKPRGAPTIILQPLAGDWIRVKTPARVYELRMNADLLAKRGIRVVPGDSRIGVVETYRGQRATAAKSSEQHTSGRLTKVAQLYFPQSGEAPSWDYPRAVSELSGGVVLRTSPSQLEFWSPKTGRGGLIRWWSDSGPSPRIREVYSLPESNRLIVEYVAKSGSGRVEVDLSQENIVRKQLEKTDPVSGTVLSRDGQRRYRLNNSAIEVLDSASGRLVETLFGTYHAGKFLDTPVIGLADRPPRALVLETNRTRVEAPAGFESGYALKVVWLDRPGRTLEFPMSSPIWETKTVSDHGNFVLVREYGETSYQLIDTRTGVTHEIHPESGMSAFRHDRYQVVEKLNGGVWVVGIEQGNALEVLDYQPGVFTLE